MEILKYCRYNRRIIILFHKKVWRKKIRYQINSLFVCHYIIPCFITSKNTNNKTQFGISRFKLITGQLCTDFTCTACTLSGKRKRYRHPSSFPLSVSATYLILTFLKIGIPRGHWRSVCIRSTWCWWDWSWCNERTLLFCSYFSQGRSSRKQSSGQTDQWDGSLKTWPLPH